MNAELSLLIDSRRAEGESLESALQKRGFFSDAAPSPVFGNNNSMLSFNPDCETSAPARTTSTMVIGATHLRGPAGSAPPSCPIDCDCTDIIAFA